MISFLFGQQGPRLVAASAVAFIASSCFAPKPSLTFQTDGRTITVGSNDRQRIIQKIEAIVRSASFNSRDHPDWFTNRVDFRAVEEISKDSFLHLHHTSPVRFKTLGGELIAEDVWIDIQSQNPNGGGLPGPISLVGEGKITWLTKESGFLVIGLGLDPVIYPHLPQPIRKTLDAAREAYEQYLRERHE